MQGQGLLEVEDERSCADPTCAICCKSSPPESVEFHSHQSASHATCDLFSVPPTSLRSRSHSSRASVGTEALLDMQDDTCHADPDSTICLDCDDQAPTACCLEPDSDLECDDGQSPATAVLVAPTVLDSDSDSDVLVSAPSTPSPQVARGSDAVDGCSCVGFYAFCLCGFLQRARARLAETAQGTADCSVQPGSSPILDRTQRSTPPWTCNDTACVVCNAVAHGASQAVSPTLPLEVMAPGSCAHGPTCPFVSELDVEADSSQSGNAGVASQRSLKRARNQYSMIGAGFWGVTAGVAVEPIDLEPDSAPGALTLETSSCSRILAQVRDIQALSPIEVPFDVAKQASLRFPDDLQRSIAEACRILCSPKRSRPDCAGRFALSSNPASLGRSRSPRALPIPSRGPFSPSPSPCPSISQAERVAAFWCACREAVDLAVEKLYKSRLEIDPQNIDALVALFHNLPVGGPVEPRHFGLNVDRIFQQELELWKQRVVESASFAGTIADAWNRQLDVVKLLPFFLAVLCQFAERAGIAREFPFGFLLTLGPWVCHRDLRAAFNPKKPEHETRPRMFVNLIADSNCGKSPFFRQCFDAVFVSHTPARPCLVERQSDKFVQAGPGKDKTLFLQQCTNSDFAKRMKASKGHLCWASEEAWSALDVAWAKGKSWVAASDRKVQHCYLQNTQNGNSYGPLSINAEQFFVPTTNFAFFHAGQPKVIHDYWGQAFMKDCPFGGMGWEFRPTFLWPRNQPEDNPDMPHITFSGANQFMQDLLEALATNYGQALDSKDFASHPLKLSPEAVHLWDSFRHQAESDKEAVPAQAAGAVGKYCFTTTTHVMACHLLSQAFREVKSSKAQCMRPAHSNEPLFPCESHDMQHIPACLLLAAPEHLNLMLTGILTCYNEMKLPAPRRAGPPVLSDDRKVEARDDEGQSPDEVALAILLQRCQRQADITVTHVNTVLPRRMGFRSDQPAICRLLTLLRSLVQGSVWDR